MYNLGDETRMPEWVRDPFTLRYALSIPKEEIFLFYF